MDKIDSEWISSYRADPRILPKARSCQHHFFLVSSSWMFVSLTTNAYSKVCHSFLYQLCTEHLLYFVTHAKHETDTKSIAQPLCKCLLCLKLSIHLPPDVLHHPEQIWRYEKGFISSEVIVPKTMNTTLKWLQPEQLASS